MFKIPFAKPETIELDKLPQTVNQSRTHLTFDKGTPYVMASTSYKTKIANRYHSIEAADIRVKDRGNTPTYQTLALMLFAIRRLGKTKESEPSVFTVQGGEEKVLSVKLSDFVNEIVDTDTLYVKVNIGEKETPFCFSIMRGDDRVHVTTRVYHPKDLSADNILNLLSAKINVQMRQLDAILYKINCLRNSRYTFRAVSRPTTKDIKFSKPIATEDTNK